MPHATRPVIAIDAELTFAPTPKTVVPARYAEAVHRAGGFPWILPPIEAEGFVDELLDRVDGILFAGGDDFDTDALGLGATHPRAKPVPSEKQRFDLALARGALDGGKAVLGICYGMQLLGLAQGARLFQHLPHDRPGSADHTGGVRHDVRIERGSKLAQLVGVPPVGVISRHHQALASVGEGWQVTARDPEGLIEGVEHADHPFAVGVQWHPELEEPGTRHDGLFTGLVEAAIGAYETRLEGAAT